MALGAYAGFMGICNISGIGNVRFADGNLAAKQEILIPDMIMGDMDHDAWDLGPYEVGGTLSGPATRTFVSGTGGDGLLSWACRRDSCGQLGTSQTYIIFYCGGTENKRSLGNAIAQSLTFSCAAGDTAQWSLDLIATGIGALEDASDPVGMTKEEDLIMWDECSFDAKDSAGTSYGLAIQNFEITVNNNATFYYAVGTGRGKAPFSVIEGLRTITGNFSFYGTKLLANGVACDVDFSVGGIGFTTRVAYEPSVPTASITPVLSTVNFTSVGPQTGTFWRST